MTRTVCKVYVSSAVNHHLTQSQFSGALHELAEAVAVQACPTASPQFVLYVEHLLAKRKACINSLPQNATRQQIDKAWSTCDSMLAAVITLLPNMSLILVSIQARKDAGQKRKRTLPAVPKQRKEARTVSVSLQSSAEPATSDGGEVCICP